MINIKVCGMCDPANVKEIAEVKPDFMGFIFFQHSPRYVGEKPDISLFRNIPPEIKKVGVFVNEDINRIVDIANYSQADIVQLHGSESVDYCMRIRSTGLKIIKVFNIGLSLDKEALKPYLQVCDYFLFDTKADMPGGSGMKFNWSILDGYTLDKPYFLSGGIGPDDAGIIKAAENSGLIAVDINSRFEISTGIKDAALIKTFINELNNNKI
jgi:phosphoribosylanthranilate isomerase